MRILLSEGQSTSARETVTALAGHHIEVADPHAWCFCRFSRFVERVHVVPGIATDPKGYVDAVVALVQTGRFDVLLATHEQGYVLSKSIERLAPHVAVALPAFDAFDEVLRKSRFSRLLSRLGLPQPQTHIVASMDDIGQPPFPFVLKQDIGTASRGVWIVGDAGRLDEARRQADLAGPVLVQAFVDGDVEHAQSVFTRGRLVGMHAYRRLVLGAGGGEALKESVQRPLVEDHMRQLGSALAWHGALSVDYVLKDGTPYYIDGNPRLVEPMSAALAGLDLAGLLVKVSLGEDPGESPASRPGVRTMLAMQALLGVAARSGSRRAVASEMLRLWRRTGPYEGATEELTPVARDPWCAVPLAVTAAALLATPGAAESLPQRGWGAQLLTRQSADFVREGFRPR